MSTTAENGATKAPVLDERGGLPSASGIGRIALCPGSVTAEKVAALNGAKDYESQWAERGTAIAKAVELHFKTGRSAIINDPELPEKYRDHETIDAVRTMIRQTSEVFAFAVSWIATDPNFNSADANAVRTHTPSNREWVMLSEMRMWLDAGRGLRVPDWVNFSGKPDALFLNTYRGICIIVDHKSGWNAVDEPLQNLQLLSLAALAAENTSARHFVLAIVQPEAGTPKLGYINRDNILLWHDRVLQLYLARGSDPFAPRVPGHDQCMLALAASRSGDVDWIKNNASEAYMLGALAEHTAEAAKIEIVRRLSADPKSVPGFKLRNMGKRYKIVDKRRAALAVNEVLGRSEDIDRLLSELARPTLSQFAEHVADVTGWKEKTAKEAVIKALGDDTSIITSTDEIVALVHSK